MHYAICMNTKNKFSLSYAFLENKVCTYYFNSNTPPPHTFYQKNNLYQENSTQIYQIELSLSFQTKNLSNHSLGCLERWKFPCMIIEGLQYDFGELYWRTKPRGVRNDLTGSLVKVWWLVKILFLLIYRNINS